MRSFRSGGCRLSGVDHLLASSLIVLCASGPRAPVCSMAKARKSREDGPLGGKGAFWGCLALKLSLSFAAMSSEALPLFSAVALTGLARLVSTMSIWPAVGKPKMTTSGLWCTTFPRESVVSTL